MNGNSQGISLSVLNINAFFSALASPDTILRLHPYDRNHITLTGTVTDPFADFRSNDVEFDSTKNLNLVLDTPFAAIIQSKQDPILVTSIRLENSIPYKDSIGKKITVEGDLSGEIYENSLSLET